MVCTSFGYDKVETLTCTHSGLLGAHAVLSPHEVLQYEEGQRKMTKPRGKGPPPPLPPQFFPFKTNKVSCLLRTVGERRVSWLPTVTPHSAANEQKDSLWSLPSKVDHTSSGVIISKEFSTPNRRLSRSSIHENHFDVNYMPLQVHMTKAKAKKLFFFPETKNNQKIAEKKTFDKCN